jgi:hypothetical protein
MAKLIMPSMFERGGVWWIRKGVPVALREPVARYLGKAPDAKHPDQPALVYELWRSLGAKDQREAKKRYPDKLKEIDAILDAARRGEGPRDPNPAITLSVRDRYALATDWYKRELDHAGVSGLSVDALSRSYFAREGQYDESVNVNRQADIDRLQLQQEGFADQNVSANNRIQQANVGTLVGQIGSAGLQAYDKLAIPSNPNGAAPTVGNFYVTPKSQQPGT